MRVTSNMSADNALYNIQQNRARLDRLQELSATSQNINRPSDDPINSRLLLDIGDKIKAGDQYLSNIQKSDMWQKTTDTALTGMSDTMQLAKTLVNSISSGTTDINLRNTVVTQLQALKQQMVDMGNTQLGEQYIFGGAKNSTQPFSATAPYYSGDETALKVEIGNNTNQQINILGNQLLTGTSTSVPANTIYGTVNIMKSFDDLIAAVNANDVPGMVAGSQALYDGSLQIDNARSDVASRTMRLDSMSKLNANTRNTLEIIYGNTQNVDYAKLAVELNQQKTAFDAALSTTAKLSQLSLLDYM